MTVATIPAAGSRWRCKGSGDVVEVEEVSYAPLGGWIVISRRLTGDGPPRVIAKAHWFTTEGYEHVEPVSAP